MSTIAQRVFGSLFRMLWPWATGAWSFISRLLGRGASAVPCDTEQQKTHTSQSPSRSLRSDATRAQDPPQCPRRIRYVPVPGEWERKHHPGWPESAFRIPNVIPEGYIYYIRKGQYVRRGSTALVERLPSGHIAKTPLPNPYDRKEKQRGRQNMEHEHNVYLFIGQNLLVPKLIDWDNESKTLVLQDSTNGDLETYLGNHSDADIVIRRKWTLQVAQALQSLHVIGVFHQDVTPRNFLLDENLDLRICDFAGSSYPGHTTLTGAPGPRYQSRVWGRGYIPTQADDIFSLGSVLYFIMCGEEPHSSLDESEVEHRFENSDFPASDHLGCGNIILHCWNGKYAAADQVLQSLLVHFKEANPI